MTAVVEVPAPVATYLERLVDAISGVAELDAAYLLGSAALGAYLEGSSDLDVVAVTSRPLSLDERRRLADAAEAIPCPARKLELVVYPRGSEEWEINLNTGEHVSFDPADEHAFWFVLDRAIAEQHAVPLVGPRWAESFPPVERDAVLDALEQALDVVESPNVVRAWAWVETGDWLSKRAADEWLRDRVRAAIEAAR